MRDIGYVLWVGWVVLGRRFGHCWPKFRQKCRLTTRNSNKVVDSKTKVVVKHKTKEGQEKVRRASAQRKSF